MFVSCNITAKTFVQYTWLLDFTWNFAICFEDFPITFRAETNLKQHALMCTVHKWVLSCQTFQWLLACDISQRMKQFRLKWFTDSFIDRQQRIPWLDAYCTRHLWLAFAPCKWHSYRGYCPVKVRGEKVSQLELTSLILIGQSIWSERQSSELMSAAGCRRRQLHGSCSLGYWSTPKLRGP